MIKNWIWRCTQPCDTTLQGKKTAQVNKEIHNKWSRVSIFVGGRIWGWTTTIENRRYREELKESLGMNFFSPFAWKGSSKCTNHVNVHKLYAVKYNNTVCSLDYSFQFRNV